MKSNENFSNESGFTLVELLVVIAIISVLAGMLAPVLENSIDSAHQIKCLNSQKEIARAVYFYTEDNDGLIPKRSGYVCSWTPSGEWQEYIADTYLSYDSGTLLDSSGNRIENIFTCPSHKTPWTLHSLLSSYGFNYWIQDIGLKVANIKHPDKLFMVGDSENGRYIIRGPFSATESKIASRHNSGANLVFMDTHAEWRHSLVINDHTIGDPFWEN